LSKIALSGNASGTGTFTLASPNSSTDRTLNLPDNSGTLITTATSAASVPGYGNLTGADQWRQTTNTTISANAAITANWERVDSNAFGNIGTGMSESSGIFTFPSTGYWLVYFNLSIFKAGDARDVGGNIQVTLNNSTYTTVSAVNLSIEQAEADNTHNSGDCKYLFDITDTANQKLRFSILLSGSGATLYGETTINRTHVTFIRIGDT
jgi:hypothetical protein